MSWSHLSLARGLPGLIGLTMVLACGGKGRAAELTLLGEPSQWSLVEFTLTDVPVVANPFDPEVIRVDGAVRAPASGSGVLLSRILAQPGR